ncbi:molecular chaperone ClpB, partial [Candidatus Magnetomorum sp. HK-1]
MTQTINNLKDLFTNAKKSAKNNNYRYLHLAHFFKYLIDNNFFSFENNDKIQNVLEKIKSSENWLSNPNKSDVKCADDMDYIEKLNDKKLIIENTIKIFFEKCEQHSIKLDDKITSELTKYTAAAKKNLDANQTFKTNNSPKIMEQENIIITDKIIKNLNFPPIIGRDREIWNIIDILGSYEKNSVLIVGESGVGKTSLDYC